MPDVFTKRKRSEVMSRIRSRGNRDTELALAKLLRAHGVTGWRRQVLIKLKGERVEELKRRNARTASTLQQFNSLTALSVRPNFVFPKQRLAVSRGSLEGEGSRHRRFESVDLRVSQTGVFGQLPLGPGERALVLQA